VLETVKRERLPAMQNYVYRTRGDAERAPWGRLSISACRLCGFAWNREFDPSLLVYDAGYDNTVPSAVMGAHYRDTATFLGERYDLEGGLVLDVGCGNGEFLQTLSRVIPGARGLGIDPALDSDRSLADGRVRLVKQVFSSDLVQEWPSLVVCRHVLEHIPDPLEFLASIHAAVARFGAVPCFLEVPDLRWILANAAFQDFCYEHCNYFTADSLAETARRAGLEPVAAHDAFGSQYLALEALSEPERPPLIDGVARTEVPEDLSAYAETESTRIAAARDRLRGYKDEGCPIVVWGAATKGVLFTFLVDPDTSLIDLCVDVNPAKQGAFVPLTGHRIASPPELGERLSDRTPVVVVMNENYREEIRGACAQLGIDATLVSWAGEPI
jgi:SAM-dependent methyltransferase